MSATATVARSFLRSATARTASRLGTAPKAKPARSPFSIIPKQNSLSNRLFRFPVEMSCCAETMLPYHTATASALLTSTICVSRRSCWTTQGKDKTRRRSSPRMK